MLSLHREGPGRYKGFLHATAVQLSDSNPRGNQTTKEEIQCSSAEGENPLILKFTWQCQRHIAIRPFKLCHLHIRAGDLCLRRLQLCLERGKTPAEPHDTRRRSVVPPALLSSPVDEKAGGGCAPSMPGRDAGSAGSLRPGGRPRGVTVRGDQQEAQAPSAPVGQALGSFAKPPLRWIL